MSGFTNICHAEDIDVGQMKEFTVEGQPVLVLNAGGTFIACSGICPHQHFHLCDGMFDGEVLTCTEHLWQWDIETGEPMGEAEECLGLFEVEVKDGTVYVKK